MKNRVITALLGMPIVFGTILFAPAWLFQLLIGLLTMRGAWEWARMSSIEQRAGQMGYVAVIAVLMLLIKLIGWLSISSPVLLVSLLWWAIATVCVIGYPATLPPDQPAQKRVATAGLFILLPFWVSICGLHAAGGDGRFFVILSLIFVWATDTGAYAFGMAWGKHKLAPKVSPGKTWEGFGGGFFGAAVIATYCVWLMGYDWKFWLLIVFIVPISVVGDLTESIAKRHGGVKDSGSILPGHGGVLDRIDSLAAAIPLFAVAVAWFGLGN